LWYILWWKKISHFVVFCLDIFCIRSFAPLLITIRIWFVTFSLLYHLVDWGHPLWFLWWSSKQLCWYIFPLSCPTSVSLWTFQFFLSSLVLLILNNLPHWYQHCWTTTVSAILHHHKLHKYFRIIWAYCIISN